MGATRNPQDQAALLCRRILAAALALLVAMPRTPPFPPPRRPSGAGARQQQRKAARNRVRCQAPFGSLHWLRNPRGSALLPTTKCGRIGAVDDVGCFALWGPGVVAHLINRLV